MEKQIYFKKIRLELSVQQGQYNTEGWTQSLRLNIASLRNADGYLLKRNLKRQSYLDSGSNGKTNRRNTPKIRSPKWKGGKRSGLKQCETLVRMDRNPSKYVLNAVIPMEKQFTLQTVMN